MARRPYLLLALGSLLLAGTSARASVDKLLPRPQYVETLRGRCSISRLKPEGRYLQDEIKGLLRKHGYSADAHGSTFIRTTIVPSIPKIFFNKDEAYRLRITPSGISIDSPDIVGLYRGLQTLEQLILSADRKGELEACDIIDWPAFRMRGLMLGLGDTFVPMDELKKQIRLLSQYKVNALHLHLTDREAWRLGSQRYPQLTDPKYTALLPGKYYSPADLEELARLCQEHRITLIPELDLAGASGLFSRAMGFEMHSPQGKRILKELLTELSERLDLPYIHLVTNEASPKDPRFTSELVAHVESLGRKAIVWDPAAQFGEKAVDLLHLSSAKGLSTYAQPATEARLRAFEASAPSADLEMLYSRRILGLSSSASSQRGAILCVWGDRPAEAPRAVKADSGLYPHMLALAERAWLGGGSGYFSASTSAGLPEVSAKTREAFVDFERRLLWHKARIFVSEPFSYVAQAQGSKATTPSTTAVATVPKRPETKGSTALR